MNMEMDDRDVLESLCRDVRDSVDGYREAAYLISAHPHAAIFRNRAEQREKMLETLDARLKTLLPPCEEPCTEGTLRGKLHQQFMDFRTLFQSDEAAALAEIEKMEEYLSAQLREALGKHLSLESYALVTDLLTIVDSSRDEAQALQATA